MNLQEICARTPASDVERFMNLARQSLPPEDVQLLSAMLEDAMTPWRASRVVSDETGTSVHTLYVRATTLAREIHAHFDLTIEDWAEMLEEQGYIDDMPNYLLPALRRLARRSGWRIRETTRIVLESEE